MQKIADWNSLPECLKAIEKPQRFKVVLKIYLMKTFQETELCDFCFTESMIHVHLFLPVVFGCDNHVGFLNVPRGCLRVVIVVFPDHTHLLFVVTMPDMHTSGCPLLYMGGM